MNNMGQYEILSHIAMPECSIRIIGVKETEHVAPHYHEKCTQIYTVLEGEVEAQMGDHTFRLRPYETVRIEKGAVHSVCLARERALFLSLSIPPLEQDDQHVVE